MLISPGRYPSDLMQRHRVQVTADGADVVMQIGSNSIRMPYETALQLSQWLRVRGKEAKRRAGDVSQHWSVLAVLEGLKG